MPARLLLLLLFIGLAGARGTVISDPGVPVVSAPNPPSVSGPPPRAQTLRALPANAEVFAAHESSAVQDYRENPAAVQAMVEALLLRLTQAPNVRAAWQSLVQPGDKVGVKISTQGGPLFSTHPAVLKAVLEGLQSAGVPRARIVVWDGVHGVQDVDRKATFTAAVLGKLIWGDVQFREKREDVSSLSHLSRVLTSGLTKIINLPVLSSSEGNGVAGAIYNLTVTNIDNWRRLTVEPNSGDPGLAELYADPNIAPKVVLTLMDGLTAQFAAGPAFQPNYSFAHATLYASRDPVALDSIALGQINEWRKLAKLPPVATQAAYLRTASELGLGVAEPERIRVIPVATFR